MSLFQLLKYQRDEDCSTHDRKQKIRVTPSLPCLVFPRSCFFCFCLRPFRSSFCRFIRFTFSSKPTPGPWDPTCETYGFSYSFCFESSVPSCFFAWSPRPCTLEVVFAALFYKSRPRTVGPDYSFTAARRRTALATACQDHPPQRKKSGRAIRRVWPWFTHPHAPLRSQGDHAPQRQGRSHGGAVQCA